MSDKEQEQITYWQQLYQEKNDHLTQFLDPVQPHEFYRDIFPVGAFERKGHYEDGLGNAIAVTLNQYGPETGVALVIEDKEKAQRYTITDDLELLGKLQDTAFTILSPISYYGKRRCGRNARYLYALVFDLDGVGMPQLRDVLHQMNQGILPKASYIVNSGTGLHLYYLFVQPIPLYPQNQKYLNELKYSLTWQIWNRYTSNIKDPQMQGIMQGFRMVGSGTKLGKAFPVVAFRFGGRIELSQLMEYIPNSNGERHRVEGILQKSNLSLEQAKKKFPEWYERRIVHKEKRGRWVVNRALYDWWYQRISQEIRVGHRFYGIMTLAIYAKKCQIDEDELHRDAFALLDGYDSMSVEEINHFTEDDIICALEMFNEDYITFPRDDIARLSGLLIKPNKRNGRKQVQHLQIARAIRDIVNDDWRKGNGRPSVAATVIEYQRRHPTATKAEVIRGTGLSKPTVYKYYVAQSS